MNENNLCISRNLRGPKNCLHSNLFASFIIRAVTFFLREYILIDGFTLSGNVMFFGGLLAYNEDDYVSINQGYYNILEYKNLLYIILAVLHAPLPNKHYLMSISTCSLTSSFIQSMRVYRISHLQKWIICKVIMTARQYSIVANYMFTLMEGVYLHNLIFLNFFTNSGEVAAYVFMGWGRFRNF